MHNQNKPQALPFSIFMPAIFERVGLLLRGDRVRWLQCLSMLLVSTLSWPVFAAGGMTANQAERYIQRSGIGEMLNSLQGSVAQRLDLSRLQAAGINVEASTQATLSHALGQVDAQQLAKRFFMSDQVDARLLETLAFLESPLGVKVTDAESAASAPEAQQAMHVYSLELASHPLPQKRMDLINRLVEQAHMSEAVMRLMERLVLMPGDLAMHLADEEKAMQFKQALTQEWGTMRPALMVQFEQLVSMSAQYSYRELSEKELSDYIAFLGTPQGQAYWQTSLELVDLYLNQFVETFVTLMSEPA